MNKEVILEQYEELKRNRYIIEAIEPNFFFEIVDCLLKENEELKTELERQKDINRVINQKGLERNYEKALEKTMTKFLKSNMAKDFIPVQKVKDKIEELKEKSRGNVFHIQQTISAEIRLLKELIEEREEK